MKLLITGASGFVGSFLQKTIAGKHDLLKVSREKTLEILESQSYPEAYNQIDALIHLAGRAHVMQETAKDVYRAYASVNIDYTLTVAELAKRLNVKRVVFLSSVKINGELSNQPFTEKDNPAPEDAYGITKLEAEDSLQEFCKNHQIELVIIRPPLIYGPGVKANFKQLIKLCQLKLPLPFGAIHNKRSMVYLENLIDFIILCAAHPKAANETFLISDDEDISTTALIKTIRKTFGLPSLLIPIPQSWVVFMLNIIGKKSLAIRLCGNLQVDITKAKTLVGWKPVCGFNEGINKMLQGDSQDH